MFCLGSVVATHFLWYFMYLGGALGTVVGEFHPTPWWHFYPFGFCAAALFAGMGCRSRLRKLNKIKHEAQPRPACDVATRASHED